jgi:hypothetical protein
MDAIFQNLKKHKTTVFLLIIIFFLVVLIIFLITFTPSKKIVLTTPTQISTTTPEKSQEKQTQHFYIKNKDLEFAVNDFLGNQEKLIWKTKHDSHVFCSIENLIVDREIFPIYVWAYCAEYEMENNTLKKLSGFSGPLKISYPNELSYFDMQQFSYSTPRDGSLYMEDVKKIFPENAQGVIESFDTKDIELKNKEYASLKIQEWQEIKKAIVSCNVETKYEPQNQTLTISCNLSYILRSRVGKS